MKENLNVAMVGYGFMAKAHSHAFRSLGAFYPDLPSVNMATICGRNAEAVENARKTFGWKTAETDWRKLLDRDDIDVIDIVTPGSSHAEMAIAALKAGKHVICEKPLANSIAEAEAMVKAAKAAEAQGIFSTVAFNYRCIPAMALAQKLIQAGKVGQIFHVRASYLQDWIVDPEFPLVWRLDKSKAGSGALGDIGSHIIDLAHFLTGAKIVNVSGRMKTFVTERPLPGIYTGLSASNKSEERGPVTVDDATLFTAECDDGSLANFEATRFATGQKNGINIEINGSAGSLTFNFENMNELLFYENTTSDLDGFKRILVTESTHPYMSSWWPPGHVIGYEHTFTHEISNFVGAIQNKSAPSPTFSDGLYIQNVMAAVEESASQEARIVEVRSKY